MRPTLLAVIFALVTGLCGCAHNGALLPVQTKAEARLHAYGNPVVVRADYMKLLRHWDENTAKPIRGIINPVAYSRIEIFESDRTAQILIGDGFVSGMIELVGTPDGTTTMTTYAWGGDFKQVVEWRDMIAAAPFAQH